MLAASRVAGQFRACAQEQTGFFLARWTRIVPVLPANRTSSGRVYVGALGLRRSPADCVFSFALACSTPRGRVLAAGRTNPFPSVRAKALPFVLSFVDASGLAPENLKTLEGSFAALARGRACLPSGREMFVVGSWGVDLAMCGNWLRVLLSPWGTHPPYPSKYLRLFRKFCS